MGNAPVPAVPAQEAPREWLVVGGVPAQVAEPQAGAQVPSQDEPVCKATTTEDEGTFRCTKPRNHTQHVGFCDEAPHITLGWRDAKDEEYQTLAGVARDNYAVKDAEIAELRAHLNSIKSYATEAAKTPITRERIKATTDLENLILLAYAQSDELQGFCRLVLSEIGGGK